MDVHISEQFVPPQFMIYDGMTDPEAHIKTFTNVMAFRTGSDAIWCRAFSLSLEGEALEWFNSLPPNSIENFEGMRVCWAVSLLAAVPRTPPFSIW